ncbi:MAG: NirD/YgiW/YdeI family stress tolerance protein [Spirochaetaceae bacterium]|nr:NirD/YgiW/YdeI family stress tolerance protein [Spirochaetaceae bacterium]
MKKIIILSLFVFLASGAGLIAQSGFTGPSNQSLNIPQSQNVSVQQAHSLANRARVILSGYIVRHARGEHYVFRDDSGEIEITINRQRWNGLQVSPSDLIEISGEVSAGRNRASFIKVEGIRLLP